MAYLTVLVLAVALSPNATSNHDEIPFQPEFVMVDRALGENANDAPLRSCMTAKAEALLTESGASAADPGAPIDYSRLLEYLARPDQRDSDWDRGVLTRGTIPWQILTDCHRGLMAPNIAVGDLDGDNLPEVAYYGPAGELRVYWNEGLGQFTPSVVDPLRYSYGDTLPTVPFSFVDVNDDGALDIVLADLSHKDVRTLLNTGSRTFAPTAISMRGSFDPVAGSAWSAANADVNKDGRTDLVVVARAAGRTVETALASGMLIRPVRVLINVGGDGFWDEQTLELFPEMEQIFGGQTRNAQSDEPAQDRSGAYTPVVADFNNDSWPDIYVAGDYNLPHMFFWDPAKEVFVDKTRESGVLEDTQNTMGAAAVDYDNDGWMDIIATDVDRSLGVCIANRACGSVGGHRLLRNQHDGTFADIGRETGISEAGWAFGFSVTDLNMDGYTDLLIGTGDLSTSRTDEFWQASFQRPYLLARGPSGWHDISQNLLRALPAVTTMTVVASADFDGDMKPDLLLSGFENHAPYLLLNRTRGNASLLHIRGRGVGGTPTTGEGAVVTIRIDGRPDQVFVSPSWLTNYMVSVTNTGFPVGLGTAGVAEVEVRFASGARVERTIRSGTSYVITEP